MTVPPRRPRRARTRPAPGALAGLVLLLLVLLGGAKEARAGFFDACLAPGEQTIEVHHDTVVLGERVFLAGRYPTACTVKVAAGVSLKLDRVRLRAAHDERLAITGGPGAELAIVNSTIRACSSGIGGTGDGPGFASVRLLNSTIVDPTGVGDCAAKEIRSDGPLTIANSRLTARDRSDIAVVARGGNLAILHSTLDAGGGIRLASGERAVLAANRFKAPDAMAVTSEDRLEAVGNRFEAGRGTGLAAPACWLRDNRPVALGCIRLLP